MKDNDHKILEYLISVWEQREDVISRMLIKLESLIEENSELKKQLLKLEKQRRLTACI